MIQAFRDLIEVVCKVDAFIDSIEHGHIKNVITFTQTWPSTALGFDVFMAGDAMTTAYTTVIQCDDECYHVFFDRRYAYTVVKPNETFINDLRNRELKNCATAKQVY